MHNNAIKFEFFENKSISKKIKHEIDFEKVKKLWDDPYIFGLKAKQNFDEGRFLVLGQIGSKNHTAIITYRDDNIRIISVRSSKKGDRAL